MVCHSDPSCLVVGTSRGVLVAIMLFAIRAATTAVEEGFWSPSNFQSIENYIYSTPHLQNSVL
jgi:hypothetical protein